MVAQDADSDSMSSLKQGAVAAAKVTLKDGRIFDLNAIVDAPRPRVTLIGKSVQMSASSSDSNIRLGNQDELPQDARLTFSIRAQSPATFAYDERIEIANADQSVSTTLSTSNGSVTLQNSTVAVATLDASKSFGPSAFGPLQFRAISDGAAGDWQPLVTLVRLPSLRELKCPATPELACKLSGANLFLVDAVSSDAKFGHPVQVPDGFPGYTLPVPRPTDGQLYVKLRDDPSVVNRAILVAQQLPPTLDEAARAVARHAAATAPVASTEPDQGNSSTSQPPTMPGSSDSTPPAAAPAGPPSGT
jgi:hypothetical protein